MAFNTQIKQTEQGNLLHAFDFNVRGVVTRYTGHRTPISIAGNEYTPARISVNRSKFNSSIEKTTVEIKAELDDLTLKSAANAVPADINVTIYEVFLTTMVCRTFFVGKVIRTNLVDPKSAVIVVESNSDVFRREFPPFVHSAFCNHNLFDNLCGVQKALYETQATVSVLGTSTVTSPDILSPVFPVACTPTAGELTTWFVGGFATLFDESDVRLITAHSGDTITLQFPFDSRVTVGTTLKLFPGCQRSSQTCRDKFCNLGKNLNFPYIPRENPVLFNFK